MGQCRGFKALGMHHKLFRTPYEGFRQKNMTRPGGTLIRSKLRAINHAFGRPRGPCTEFRNIPRGHMRGYIKDPHDFERE